MREPARAHSRWRTRWATAVAIGCLVGLLGVPAAKGAESAPRQSAPRESAPRESAPGQQAPSQRAPSQTTTRAAALPPAARFPAYLTYVAGLSCPSTTECFAVGGTPWGTGAAATTADGGTSWSPIKLPAGVGGLEAISCHTTSRCVAVGKDPSGFGLALTTTNGGRSWNLHDISGAFLPAAVSCPTLDTCFTAGGGGIFGGGPGFIAVSHDGGSSWTEQDASTVQYWNAVSGISCGSASTCFVSGEDDTAKGMVIATTNGGKTWKTVSKRSVGVNGISCTDEAHCWGFTATGVIATSDGGTRWLYFKMPDTVGDPSHIACVNGGGCLLVGTDAARTGPVIVTIHGAKLSTEKFAISSSAGLDTVTCATATVCVTAGGTKRGFADLFTTRDAGSTWHLRTLPNGVNYLRDGSCPTVSRCYIAGAVSTGRGSVLATTDGGSKWTAERLPAATYILYDVFCQKALDCEAVGITDHQTGVLVSTTDGGSEWTLDHLPGGVASLVGVACWSTSDCIAIGTTTSGQGEVLVTSDSGQTWTSESSSLPVGAEYLNSLACPAPSSCVIAGGTASGAALIAKTSDGGKTWTAPSLPTNLAQLYAVSCSSASTCRAAGGYVTTLSETGAIISSSDGGTDWTLHKTSSSIQYLYGISCPSDSSCEAVGTAASGAGAFTTTSDGGSSWSGATRATAGPFNGVLADGESTWWALGTTALGGALAVPRSIPAPPATTARTLPPVPKGFLANSMSWISTIRGWVLGQAPCGAKECTYVVGTGDGGSKWSLLGRVATSIVRPTAYTASPGVTSIRMVNAEDGYVFGPLLFRTTNGGRTWSKATMPGAGRQVVSLATNRNTAFMITLPCAFPTTCRKAYSLWRNPTPASNVWTKVAVALPAGTGAGLSVHGATVYADDLLLDFGQPDRLYASADDGTQFVSRVVPCGADDAALLAVSPSSTTNVGVLCEGNAAKGQAEKYAFRSSDEGATFTSAGTPPLDGILGAMAVSPVGDMLVATSSDGSFLDLDTGGTTWTSVATESTAAGWGDPTFVSGSKGYVIYGPPDASQENIGHLFTTSDGGAHWSQVPFK